MLVQDPIKQQRVSPILVVGSSRLDASPILRAVRTEQLARRIEAVTAAEDTHCSAKAVVINPLGQILILKDAGGKWHDLPGGRVQEGEDAVTALAREVREEAGISIGDIQLGETINFKAGRTPHTTLLFKATALTLDVRLSAEHSDHAWVEPKDLGDYTLGLLLAPMQRLLNPVAVQAATPVGHEFRGNQYTVIGVVNNGDPVSKKLDQGESHEHGDNRSALNYTAASKRWKFRAHDRRVVWTNEPSEEEAFSVEDHLERKHGLHPSGHVKHGFNSNIEFDGLLKASGGFQWRSVQASAHKPLDERTRYANHIAAQNEAEEANRRAVKKALAYAEVAVQEGKAKDDDGKKSLLALLLLLLLGGSGAAYALAHRRMALEAETPSAPTQAQEDHFVAQRGPLLQPFLTRVVDELELERKRGEALAETPTEIARRLAQTTEELEATQGERVAQTEAQAAYGSANLRILQKAGFETIAWVTMDDERVRESHRQCEEAGPIPIGHVFPNGLRYPGDPNGGPEEVCNCRCWLVGVKRKA